jgi:hypothetical protein
MTKSYNDYLPEYTRLLNVWREEHPEAAERFDREARIALEKKAAAAAKNKKRKIELTTPLGELVKKLFTDMDSFRETIKGLEKIAEAQENGGPHAEPQENGGEKKEEQ